MQGIYYLIYFECGQKSLISCKVQMTYISPTIFSKFQQCKMMYFLFAMNFFSHFTSLNISKLWENDTKFAVLSIAITRVRTIFPVVREISRTKRHKNVLEYNGKCAKSILLIVINMDKQSSRNNEWKHWHGQYNWRVNECFIIKLNVLR